MPWSHLPVTQSRNNQTWELDVVTAWQLRGLRGQPMGSRKSPYVAFFLETALRKGVTAKSCWICFIKERSDSTFRNAVLKRLKCNYIHFHERIAACCVLSLNLLKCCFNRFNVLSAWNLKPKLKSEKRLNTRQYIGWVRSGNYGL